MSNRTALRITGYSVIGFGGPFLIFFICFDVAVSNLVHDVETIFHLR